MYDNKYIYRHCNNGSYINKEFCDEKTFFKDLNKFLTLIKEYKEYAETLKPYIMDTVILLHNAIAENKKIVCEGAQATLLDIDFGSYPFVTSSNPSIGGICTGSGIGAKYIGRIANPTSVLLLKRKRIMNTSNESSNEIESESQPSGFAHFDFMSSEIEKSLKSAGGLNILNNRHMNEACSILLFLIITSITVY